MATTLNPYIQFADNAREAMEFYKDVFGGELTMSTPSTRRPPTASCTPSSSHPAA